MLAYQIAGDDGLKLMHAEGKAEERQHASGGEYAHRPIVVALKSKMGTLLLIDEVLLYAKVKVRSEPGWLDILTSFFQYLTQAAAKVERWLHRGIASFQRAQDEWTPWTKDRVRVVRHLPASTRSGRAAGRKG